MEGRGKVVDTAADLVWVLSFLVEQVLQTFRLGLGRSDVNQAEPARLGQVPLFIQEVTARIYEATQQGAVVILQNFFYIAHTCVREQLLTCPVLHKQV